MTDVNFSSLIDVLGFSKSRVEKWISDGYFAPIDKPKLGKARGWTKNDVGRLIVFLRLVDMGHSKEVGRAIGRLHGFKSGGSYLVIQALKATLHRTMKRSDGSFALEDTGEKHRVSVQPANKVISRLDKKWNAAWITVLDLDDIEAETERVMKLARRPGRKNK